MKIAVVAGTGRVARKVIKEAKNRNFEVTAFVRKEAEIDGADKVVVRDIFDLTKEDLSDLINLVRNKQIPFDKTTIENYYNIYNKLTKNVR